MREIKFRGMTVSGDWHFGLLSHITDKKIAQFEGNEGWFICNKVGCAYAYQIRPETVGQYTGFKDKNGKEIYEGDILSFATGYDRRHNDSEGHIVEGKIENEVKFENGCFCVDHVALSSGLIMIIGVIGNKYENPELLKQ